MVSGKFSDLVSVDYRGPHAGFTEAHILKAVLEIGKAQNVGRGKLSRVLQLGPGEVRTLIRRLKESGLIEIDAMGCTLTRKGEKEYLSISKILPWAASVSGTSLGLGTSCYAVLVRANARKVKHGIEQRDAAIKSGATGALTVLYSKGKFRIPFENTDCEGQYPAEFWRTIRSSGPKQGDVVIISCGSNDLDAEYGALSAALTII